MNDHLDKRYIPITASILTFPKASLRSTVGSASDCRSRGRKFESKLGHITSVEIDYEIIFMVILPHPLIQANVSFFNPCPAEPGYTLPLQTV